MKILYTTARHAAVSLCLSVVLFGSWRRADAQPIAPPPPGAPRPPANDDILRLPTEQKKPTTAVESSPAQTCEAYYGSLLAKAKEKTASDKLGPEAELADAACSRDKGFSDAYFAAVRAAESAGVAPQTSSQLCTDDSPTCDKAKKATECADFSIKTTTARSKCTARTKTASVIEPILVAAVGGLGDFLKERAEQELIAYAVNVLGKAVCLANGEVRRFFTLDPDGPSPSFAFKESCKTAFPDDKDLDYTAFADGRFQKVFKSEAEALPTFLIEKTVRIVPCNASDQVCATERDAWKGILTGVVTYLKPLVHGGRLRKTKAMRELDLRIKEKVTNGKLCSEAFGPACASLLTLRFGAIVEDKYVDAEGGVLDVPAVLAETVESFCKDYGDSKECVPGAPDEGTRAFIKQVAEDIRDAIELLKAAKTEADSNVARGEVIDALRLLFRATFNVARKVSANDTKAISVIDCVASAAEAALALASRDPQGAIVSIKFAVSTLLAAAPELKEKLGPTGMRALNFVLDIGGAKDASDAKKIIETAAEPLGSYRVKYEAPLVIALNGFVGPKAGGLFPLNKASGTNAPSSAEFELMPLSGPVGVDFSFRADAQHVGLMLTAIDPLGMVVVEEDGEAHVDWGRVVTPGLLFRWGIQRSPLVLFAGAHYEPLRRPDDAAGSDNPAYKGGFFAGGGIAVDIPILIFTARSLD